MKLYTLAQWCSMKSTNSVLKMFHGMSRDFLYYLESTKFISPERRKCGRVFRRFYADGDVVRIGLAWDFYQQGFPPKRAFELVEAAEKRGSCDAELDPSSFFTPVAPESPLRSSEVPSLLALPTLHAPGKREIPSSKLAFAGKATDLAEAARQLRPCLAGVRFVVITDAISAVLAGACTILFGEPEHGEASPTLLDEEDIEALCASGAIPEGSTVAIMFGLLDDRKSLDELIATCEGHALNLLAVVALATNISDIVLAGVEEQGISLTILFDREQMKKLFE